MSDDGLYHQTRASLSAISRDLQQQLDQDLGALRAALEERLAALDGVVRRSDGLFEKTAEDLTIFARQARQAADQATLRADEAETRLHALRTEFDAARGAFEGRLRQIETAREETATALEAAREEIAAARRTSEQQSATLDEAGRRVRALEAEHAEWMLARQVAEAHLEEERQRRKTIAIQLETALEELRLARAEVKSYRLQAQQVTERVSRLEAGQAASSSGGVHTSIDSDEGSAPLEQLRRDLQALSDAQSADAMLAVLLDSLGRHFETAALFAVTAQGLKYWRGRRNGIALDAQPSLIPAASDSVVGRAFRARTTTIDQEASGLLSVLGDERTVRIAAAFPVVSNDRVLAIAYMDDARDRPITDVPVWATAAEILIDRLHQRLQRTPSLPPAVLAEQPLVESSQPAPVVTESPHYVLTRQARRVPISDGVKVLVDGVASELVDLSTLGAQIVSPSVIRPNRAVKVVLGRDENPIPCMARIVWARMERGSQDALVLYRAGVEFTEANVTALQAFAAQYGTPYAPSATAIQH